MDVRKFVDALSQPGSEVLVEDCPVRTQRRIADQVIKQVPDALFDQFDPVTRIPAYTVRTPGTVTRIYRPPAQSPTDSLGSVTPSN